MSQPTKKAGLPDKIWWPSMFFLAAARITMHTAIAWKGVVPVHGWYSRASLACWGLFLVSLLTAQALLKMGLVSQTEEQCLKSSWDY